MDFLAMYIEQIIFEVQALLAEASYNPSDISVYMAYESWTHPPFRAGLCDVVPDDTRKITLTFGMQSVDVVFGRTKGSGWRAINMPINQASAIMNFLSRALEALLLIARNHRVSEQAVNNAKILTKQAYKFLSEYKKELDFLFPQVLNKSNPILVKASNSFSPNFTFRDVEPKIGAATEAKLAEMVIHKYNLGSTNRRVTRFFEMKQTIAEFLDNVMNFGEPVIARILKVGRTELVIDLARRDLDNLSTLLYDAYKHINSKSPFYPEVTLFQTALGGIEYLKGIACTKDSEKADGFCVYW